MENLHRPSWERKRRLGKKRKPNIYENSIKSQADATTTYRDSAQHLGEGSTVATSVKAQIDFQHTLYNDGTASDMAGNIIGNTENITTKGGTSIFSNCSDCLNPGTLNKI